MLQALALGEKTSVSQKMRDEYNIAGASHILALSGLHLSILYGMLLLLLGRRRRIWKLPFLLLTLWTFVFLVGCSASVIRAAAMLSCAAILDAFGRRGISLNTWGLVALVILILNPFLLFDVSFEMSFVAVLSILVFGKPLDRLWDPLVRRCPPLPAKAVRYVTSLFNVSLAAQIGTAPLVAYYFHRFAAYSVLSSLVVVPMTAILLYLFVLAVILFPLRHALFSVLFPLCSWMNRSVAWIARLPGASIDNIRMSALQLSLVYLLIIILSCILYRLGGGFRRNPD